MKSIFSPKELSKLYNRIKITYNPASYSFKDRLIESSSDLIDELISYIDYDVETELVGKIWKYWKEDTRDLQPYGYGFVDVPMSSVTHFTRLCNEIYSVNSYTVKPMAHSATLVSTDHIHFSIQNIALNLGIEFEDLKKNRALETIITAAYLTTVPSSICTDLKWLSTEIFERYSYENLHSMQFLKDGLNEKDICTPLNLAKNILDSVNCPVPVAEKAAKPCDTFATDKGKHESQILSSTYDNEAYKTVLKNMYRETIAFGLEVVYMLDRFLDTYTHRAAYEVLTGSMSKEFNNITDCIYKGDPTLGVFQPAIKLSDIQEERFIQISEYLASDTVCKAIDYAVHCFVNCIEYVKIPSLFGAIISFARNYSFRNIRIKQCAILYNYCKTNKLLDTDSDHYLIDALKTGAFSEAIAEEDAAMAEEERKSRSMMDLRESRKAAAASKPGGGHTCDDVSQALDGLVNNFRTSKYGFTIEEVYSDDEKLKLQYESILSKIKLVNVQLIKQIREIKTYNTGGKEAGISSGKLDKKNLYKYKTDKNIFYQNTYKQKECDPAFGIILDASGSMSGRGISDGKTTMIVLHETLKALGINHSIIDHTCYGRRYTSDLRRYQCFREDKGYRLRKNYALAGIRAESGNCDSGALWFMEKALLRTKNQDKICLIFSDGAPTECSGTDLVEQVRSMERKGIKVIGIGIGFPNISKYYSDYANGNNLKEMLDIVAGILKEYVIAKKD